VLDGVDGGFFICGGFIHSLVVACSNFDSKFGMSIVVFL
jgi:hypothetical protein